MADERGAIHGKQGGPSHYGSTDNSHPHDPEGGPSSDGNNVEVIYVDTKGWKYIKYRFREAFAEFLGTFTFVTFGIGSIAQAMLSGGGGGNWTTISLGFGLGLALAISISGSVSGGHLNPAVTITLAVYRRFPWLKVPIYIIAQTLGAFTAAAVVFLNYHAAISKSGLSNRDIAGIFATYPQPFMNPLGSFFSEALGTFFLLIVIFAVTDERNITTAKIVGPVTIGLALTTIALSLGYETGFSLNGARDFGPRLFTLFAGYGFNVFTDDYFYFWIPLIAPVIGGLVAGFVYDSLVYWGKSPLN